MKLLISIIMLISVAISHCQRQFWVHQVIPIQPSRVFHYHYPVYPGEDEDFNQEMDPQEIDERMWPQTTESRAVNNRIVYPLTKNKNSNNNQLSESQARLFFGMMGGNSFNPSANPFSAFFRTTISTTTSTSTVATPVFVTCIPQSQFAATAVGVTCPQRKRHARELMHDMITPTTSLQKVETTEIALLKANERDPWISTSMDDALEEHQWRQQRNFFNYVVTLTTTTTVFTFNATTIKKTVAPAAAASGLTCLPFGLSFVKGRHESTSIFILCCNI